MLDEVQNVNALLAQLLQTAASTESKPYHYDKRHYSKDPEYAWSDERTQQFKQGFPAPDVNWPRATRQREGGRGGVVFSTVQPSS